MTSRLSKSRILMFKIGRMTNELKDVVYDA